jgi:hypothetical protein
LARGRTALFGSEAEVRQLNEYDCVHRVILADGVTSFDTAVYDPGPRWPEAWTSGAALASRRGGALLTGHPVRIGDLIQITGALPSGQIKAHCLIWDVDYDLVVFNIKKELRAWNGKPTSACSMNSMAARPTWTSKLPPISIWPRFGIKS